MVYQTLPTSATSLAIFEDGLSPYYDIIWSFDYRLSNINPTDEFGFCFFLQDASNPLSGGGVGVDLGYSGLSSYSPSGSAAFGMLSAIIGVGFDSTGQFALSTNWPGGKFRDGLTDSQKLSNSVAIRGSYPSFSYLNYYKQVTAFNIIDSSPKTLRARLGNFGRTIYVDYRPSPATDYVNVVTQNIDLYFDTSTRYRPGVSFVKPISSQLPSSQLKVIVSNFHVEGKNETPVFETYSFTPLSVFSVGSEPLGPDIAAPITDKDFKVLPPLPPQESPVTTTPTPPTTIPPTTTTTTTTVAPANTTTPTPSADMIPCSQTFTARGGHSPFPQPNVYKVYLGSGTGRVDFTFETYGVPDKFEVWYNGGKYIDTGYRGDKKYQAQLDRALAKAGLPSETINTTHTATLSFCKAYGSVTYAEVRDYSPLAGTAWNFSISCPVSVPGCL